MHLCILHREICSLFFTLRMTNAFISDHFDKAYSFYLAANARVMKISMMLAACLLPPMQNNTEVNLPFSRQNSRVTNCMKSPLALGSHQTPFSIVAARVDALYYHLFSENHRLMFESPSLTDKSILYNLPVSFRRAKRLLFHYVRRSRALALKNSVCTCSSN